MSRKTTSLSNPTFFSHLRALAAIAKRDWLEFWRYPLNAFSHVLQPIIWLTPVYFMGKAFSVNGEALGFAAYTGTSDYMSFILLGAALSNFISAVFWGMGYSLKNDMNAGVLESNWLAPLPRPLLMAGRTAVNLLITTILSVGILATAGLVFGFRPTGNALQAVLAVLPMLIGLYGFGFAFAALVLLLRDANMLVDMGQFMVQLFSGADFPVTVLPRWLLPLALAIPITYGFDVFRAYLIKTRTLLPVQVEVAVLVVFMFVMISFGLWVFHWLEHHVRTRGTLGQY
jgi:ABC-2 type transport system permease protein